MVIVTHEIGFAEKVASRLIFIDKGRIAEDGNPQELVKNPPSQRLAEFCNTSPDPQRLSSPDERAAFFKILFPLSASGFYTYLFVYVFSTEVPMPWILLLLAALLPRFPPRYPYPAYNPTANGLIKTAPAGTGYRTEKSAYAALADVLDNDTSRKELIDQLRKAPPRPLRTAPRR